MNRTEPICEALDADLAHDAAQILSAEICEALGVGLAPHPSKNG